MFNEAFDANRQRIKEDNLLVIAGKASHDDYSVAYGSPPTKS